MELNALNSTMGTGSDRKYTGLTDIVERHYLPRIMDNGKARTEYLKRVEMGSSAHGALYSTLIANDGQLTNIGDHKRKFNIKGEEKKVDMHSLAGKGKAVEEAIGKADYFTLDDVVAVEKAWNAKTSNRHYQKHDDTGYLNAVGYKIRAKKRELENAKKESKPVILESKYSDGNNTLHVGDVHTSESMQDSGETHVYTAEQLAGISDAKGGRFSGMLGRIAASGLLMGYTALSLFGMGAINTAGSGYDSKKKVDTSIVQFELNPPRFEDIAMINAHEFSPDLGDSSDYRGSDIFDVKKPFEAGSSSDLGQKLGEGRKKIKVSGGFMVKQLDFEGIYKEIFSSAFNQNVFDAWKNDPKHPFYKINEQYGGDIKRLMNEDPRFSTTYIDDWLFDELVADDTDLYHAKGAVKGTINIMGQDPKGQPGNLEEDTKLKVLFIAADRYTKAKEMIKDAK